MAQKDRVIHKVQDKIDAGSFKVQDRIDRGSFKVQDKVDSSSFKSATVTVKPDGFSLGKAKVIQKELRESVQRDVSLLRKQGLLSSK